MCEKWSIVAVDTLPWGEHPFRCRWASRFERVASRDASDAERRAVVRDVALSLTADELAACPYHDGNRHQAAEAAVALVETGDTSIEAINTVIASRGLDDRTAEWFCSFFSEPIFVVGDTLGNGQHRVCAMKLAKVLRCPIEP
jgi:hypothetical protein